MAPIDILSKRILIFPRILLGILEQKKDQRVYIIIYGKGVI